MYLESLWLFRFRNHILNEFRFSPYINLIVGPNGVGKTNLLEAIYLLAFTKGFRPDSDLVSFQASEYQIEAIFEPYQWSIKVIYQKDGTGKSIYWNGKPYRKFKEHIGKIPAVLISPDEIELIKGGSTPLRQWLNKSLSLLSVKYLNDLLLYNSYLKDYKKLLLEHPTFDSTLLEALEEKVFVYGRRITLARIDYLYRFNVLFEEKFHFFNYNRKVMVAYEPTLNSDVNLFMKRRGIHKERGRIMVGPHLDRIQILLDGRDVRSHASQGQVKALLFSLKLAELEMIEEQGKSSPILLLDDLGDRLDQERLHRLFSYLSERKSQIFITDTSLDRINPLLSKVNNFTVIELQ